MASSEEENMTQISAFILLGFGNLHGVQYLLFGVFLVIYVLTLMGNIVILPVVLADFSLHSPMYFFLGHFSFLEIGYTTTIEPMMLGTLLSDHVPISFPDCACQFYLLMFFFFPALVATECFLLDVVFYDHFIAICNPLHYSSLMDHWSCLQLAAASWVAAFLALILLMVLIFWLTFCAAEEIDHLFCDLKPIMKLACTDTQIAEITSFICTSLFALGPFLLTLASYTHIISTIMRIPSVTRKQSLLYLFLPPDSSQSVLWVSGHCLWISIRASEWKPTEVAFPFVYSAYTCPQPYYLLSKEQGCKSNSEKIGMICEKKGLFF